MVNNPDGSRSMFVFSGTSFSAPQIAGAAALLIQAFPNLTAANVVDILLRSARDAGAAGTDAVYGRGILDIAAAFAPQGTTALAGSTAALPVGSTTVVTSAAMGDAASRSNGFAAIVLDGYGRAYQLDLSAGLRSASLTQKLGTALASEARHTAVGNDRLSLAFSVDGRGRVARLPWQGKLQLSSDDADQSRVLAARVVSRTDRKTTLGLAMAQGSDGLVAELQGRSRPAFLIAGSPQGNAGFNQTGEFSLALRHQFGRWGFTASAERGLALAGAPAEFAPGAGARNLGEPARRIGLALDRGFGPASLSLGAIWLKEQRTVLGARLHDGFGQGGAQSLFLDANGDWRFAGGWRLGGALRHGKTWAQTGGSVAKGSHFASLAWSLDLVRDGLFQSGDALALRLAQPLRVESGGLVLRLPAGYSYATLQPTYAFSAVSLAPRGRELDAELIWRGQAAEGNALVSLYYRHNPGHYAALPADKGVAVSWSKQF